MGAGNVFALRIGPRRLSLFQRSSPTKANELTVDFTVGETAERALRGGFTLRSPLARACRIPGLRVEDTHVWDATAGLGVDAFVLAALGFRVSLSERDPLMYALLADALHCARQHRGPLAPVVARLGELTWADARSLSTLRPQGKLAHVCYLDPMYPTLKDKALPRKGMAMARQLLAPSAPVEELITGALRIADRAVLKRPRGAPTLSDLPKTVTLIASHSSKTTRFDVYGSVKEGL